MYRNETRGRAAARAWVLQNKYVCTQINETNGKTSAEKASTRYKANGRKAAAPAGVGVEVGAGAALVVGERKDAQKMGKRLCGNLQSGGAQNKLSKNKCHDAKNTATTATATLAKAKLRAVA